MKMQVRLLFLMTVLVLAIGWIGLRGRNTALELRLAANGEVRP